MSKKIKTIDELKDRVVKDYKHEYGGGIDKFEQALIGMFEQAMHQLIDSCPDEAWKKEVRELSKEKKIDINKTGWAEFPYQDEEGDFYQDMEELLAMKFLGACACGSPEILLNKVGEYLLLLDKDSDKANEGTYEDENLYLLKCYLDSQDLIEHGTSIGHCWVSQKGREFLKYYVKWQIENTGEKNGQ